MIKEAASFILLCYAIDSYGQIFTKVDSIQLTNANIWGVVFDKGDSLGITTTQSVSGMPHIYLRKVDYNDISQQSSLKQLTFNSDFTGLTNLTDHKSIVLNNELFVSFSTIGDQDLYLFKTDMNGNRIGNVVTVVSGSSDPTNDMILTTDGTFVYVLHFSPPSQHHLYKFDTNLNQIGAVITTTTNNHNNIGQAVFCNNSFYLFTGVSFGQNTSLLKTTWDNSWQPLSSSIILQSVNGDGNWFSTGAVFDTQNNRWYIAQSHLYSGDPIGQEHIDLLAFDNNFNLLERLHVTNNSFYRPHLALKNNCLYLSYDASGAGVYLLKFQVSNATRVNQLRNTQQITLFPNPAQDEIYIQNNSTAELHTVKIYNILGEEMYDEYNISNQPISIKKYDKGIYMIRMIDENGNSITRKIIKN